MIDILFLILLGKIKLIQIIKVFKCSIWTKNTFKKEKTVFSNLIFLVRSKKHWSLYWRISKWSGKVFDSTFQCEREGWCWRICQGETKKDWSQYQISNQQSFKNWRPNDDVKRAFCFSNPLSGFNPSINS